jgi:hypothetical protein
MKFSRRLAAAISVLTLALGAGLAASGTANAGVGPIQSTPTGANSISGYYAHAINNSVDFTHLATTEGGDGQHSIEQLPVSVTSGNTVLQVNGAAGIGICNQSTGNAAQVGLVYIGGGQVDVVYATGTFTAPNPPNNNDKCQGGIVNPGGGKYLAGPFPDNNSVDLDILYDAANPHPAFHGHVFAKGTIIFAATNLGAPGVSYTAGVLSPGRTFDEADAGVVADTNNDTALAGTAPFPYAGHNTNPSELEGFSHTLADGNSVLPGGTETHGTFYSNPAWSAFPVDAVKNGKVYLGPTAFVNDGFLVLVGAPTSG